jgi:hypothetical protein
MATIDVIVIPYPDFEDGDIINSEQFDANNQAIKDKVNEIIEELNTNVAKEGNYLATDNTTPFTPDQPYEPSTKKYVDDVAEATELTVTEYTDLQISNVEAGMVTETTITQSLSYEKATIASLTVDQLDTSDAVELYRSFQLGEIDETASKVNIRFMELEDQNFSFINAVYVGDDGGVPQTVQVIDRDSNPVYWTDETRIQITTEVTSYPVTIYEYDYNTRMKWYFDQDHVSLIPKIEMGEGVGNPTYPERGRGYIYKDTEGVIVEYIKADGTVINITLGEDGIIQDGEEGTKSLRNVSIDTTEPTSPQDGDLWIDTN